MGTLVLSSAFVIEIVLAVACFATKSHLEKIRGAARVGAAVVFILLSLVSVIQWSFRWYALAALLLVWAVKATLTLLRGQKPAVEFQRKRVIFSAITNLLLVLLAVTPLLVFPQPKMLETTGQYAVASVQATYTDERRSETYAGKDENRKVNVEFWYPENAQGPFPLVIFSHGALGLNSSNLSLYRELASHGYVVGSIAHPYHALWTKDTDGQVTFLNMDYLKEIQQEDAKTDKRQSYAYYQKWMDIRTGDGNLVIDTVIKNAQDGVGGVYGLVDVEKIGVMGHSLGGSAALCLGRQRRDVSAVIALESPLLCDIQGVEQGEFNFTGEPYPVPVLNMYSDASWNHLSEWAQYGANYALLSGAQTTAFNIYIDGAGHFSFTDLPLSSPLIAQMLEGKPVTRNNEECLRITNAKVLEFFNVYLKNQGEFEASFH